MPAPASIPTKSVLPQLPCTKTCHYLSTDLLRIYNSEMKHSVHAGTRMAAWLLCMMLAWISVSSPHCDLCDGPHATVFSSSLHPAVHHPTPLQPDDCSGVCSCCGFHWLPVGKSLPRLRQIVSTTSVAEVAPPLLTPRTSPFRPPRTDVSS
jgi:hypothetical protein